MGRRAIEAVAFLIDAPDASAPTRLRPDKVRNIPATPKDTDGDVVMTQREFQPRPHGLADVATRPATPARQRSRPRPFTRGTAMNAHRRPFASLLVTAIASLAVHSHACAQAPLTRADVVAQYEEAVRTGDVLAPGDSGMKLNELYPNRYPKAISATPLTRDQVVADLQAAIRSGEVAAPGESGMKMNELFPQRYPAAAGTTVAGKTREEVRAETLEAIRTGDILAAGDSGLRLNEVYPQRYAKALAQEAARHRTMTAASTPADVAMQ
jgi:hypothetical protein